MAPLYSTTQIRPRITLPGSLLPPALAAIVIVMFLLLMAEVSQAQNRIELGTYAPVETHAGNCLGQNVRAGSVGPAGNKGTNGAIGATGVSESIPPSGPTVPFIHIVSYP